MSNPWDEEFAPSTGARNTLRWAHEMGASTLGEAYDMLEQLELSNDVPEVLGHDDTVEGVRGELESGIETVGPDTLLTTLLQASQPSLAVGVRSQIQRTEQLFPVEPIGGAVGGYLRVDDHLGSLCSTRPSTRVV